MSRFPLNEHDTYRIQKARETLAAAVDWADDRAMARRIGRLEIALEQMLEMLDEPAQPTRLTSVPGGVPDSGTGVTVTLVTVDHGPVTLPEPSWCTGHDGHLPGTYRADLIHSGPETAARFNGPSGVLEYLRAWITHAPCGELLPEPLPLVALEVDGDAVSLDPDGLRAFTAATRTHLEALEQLADEAEEIRGGGR